MTEKQKCNVPLTTTPIFQQKAIDNALELSQYSTEDLEKMLNVNTNIALTNHLRYRDFLSLEPLAIPAICAYNGIVYKNINTSDFTPDDFMYAQEHLLITSFLYGLLRPLDTIKSYRLEGNIKLPDNDGKNLFDFWKEELTKLIINHANKNGGIIVYLASEEMKELFDWKLVESKVRVIYPEFKVMKKDKLKTIVVYTKMCRGQMTRFILKNRIENIDSIKDFTWEGFSYNENSSDKNKFSFIFF